MGTMRAYVDAGVQFGTIETKPNPNSNTSNNPNPNTINPTYSTDPKNRSTDTSDPRHFVTSAELWVRYVGTGAEVSRHIGTDVLKIPSNTLSPGSRPTSVPSGILIHPTIWPQYTNVTDRQTGHRFCSIGEPVLVSCNCRPKSF